MLQLIKKLFSFKSTKKPGKKGKGRNAWAEKQFREMGKLRGKLVLM